MTMMHGAIAAVGSTFGRAMASSAYPNKIGFVGLGAMGARMARQLLAAGQDLVVFDSNSLAVERILSEAAASTSGRGTATAVTTPADLAETPGVSVIFTMLPGPAIARQVYLGQGGLLSPRAGIVPRVLVDCTTMDPPTARELAARVRATRINASTAGPRIAGLPAANPTMLDAPVSGGVIGADKGTLSFLVGGDEAVLPSVEPLMRMMGSNVTWCGDAGDAQAARLCTTLVMASTMAATAEALALARRLGVDPELMTRVLNNSSARSWVSSSYNPVPGLTPEAPASAGYRGGLRSSQVASHLHMAVEAAEQSHSPVPMARKVLEMYSQVVEEGMGDQDFAAIYRYVYGSGAAGSEWRAGEKLFTSQTP